MHVFTTGQVAKICKVAPRTVSKWFDSGRLKGYRIPGSHDRRIPREYLIKFLKEHGMPLGSLEDDQLAKVLVLSADEPLLTDLRSRMTRERSFKLAVAENVFQSGIEAETLHPDAIVIDCQSIALHEAADTCARIRNHSAFAETIIIVLGRRDEHILTDLASRANDSFTRPFDPALLVRRVHTLVSAKKELVS